MKRIRVNKVIEGFDGKPIVMGGEALVVKDMMLQYLGTFASENPQEMIVAFAIGQKVYSAESYVDLENAEYKIIEKAISKPQHGTVVFVPFKEAIDSAVELKKQKR
jgi:hypothetical protein